ncbi:basic proline-rich protein-like [Lontra canadensis]|uniref:basic proline-rich protein-like n=1 Tax=Lontra canadensis TaxID=76717 RepID=UPI0013F2F2EC|nr:basic proline-rich protein-like [Lontra canadensis]
MPPSTEPKELKPSERTVLLRLTLPACRAATQRDGPGKCDSSPVPRLQYAGSGSEGRATYFPARSSPQLISRAGSQGQRRLAQLGRGPGDVRPPQPPARSGGLAQLPLSTLDTSRHEGPSPPKPHHLPTPQCGRPSDLLSQEALYSHRAKGTGADRQPRTRAKAMPKRGCGKAEPSGAPQSVPVPRQAVSAHRPSSKRAAGLGLARRLDEAPRAQRTSSRRWERRRPPPRAQGRPRDFRARLSPRLGGGDRARGPAGTTRLARSARIPAGRRGRLAPPPPSAPSAAPAGGGGLSEAAAAGQGRAPRCSHKELRLPRGGQSGAGGRRDPPARPPCPELSPAPARPPPPPPPPRSPRRRRSGPARPPPASAAAASAPPPRSPTAGFGFQAAPRRPSRRLHADPGGRRPRNFAVPPPLLGRAAPPRPSPPGSPEPPAPRPAPRPRLRGRLLPLPGPGPRRPLFVSPSPPPPRPASSGLTDPVAAGWAVPSSPPPPTSGSPGSPGRAFNPPRDVEDPLPPPRPVLRPGNRAGSGREPRTHGPRSGSADAVLGTRGPGPRPPRRPARPCGEGKSRQTASCGRRAGPRDRRVGTHKPSSPDSRERLRDPSAWTTVRTRSSPGSGRAPRERPRLSPGLEAPVRAAVHDPAPGGSPGTRGMMGKS